jgi:alkylation response protein AidB-like acyl-CoA dehydrogenase
MTIAVDSLRAYGDAASQDVVQRARDLAPTVRSYADQVDRERRLPAALVAELKAAGLFHALLPRDVGGLEVDPINSARIVEEVARADGSTGWCVMLAAQSCGFAGFLPKEEARTIYSNGGIVAGTARPIGRAVAREGGYDVSGRWPFASGSTHATWFAGECIIYDGDQKRLDADGNERTKMLFVPASEVTIHDTWDTLGLRGTASNDFSIEHATVPESRGFQVLVDPPLHEWPLYRAEPLAFINHGAHALGLAKGAIDCAIEIAGSKHGWGGVLISETPRMQSAVAEASAIVGAASNYLYEASWALWQQALAGETQKPLRATVRLATSNAARAGLQAIDLLHAAVGTSSIMSSSPLSRILRDMHTASAHVMIGTMTYEAAGRVLMGLDAAFPFF